MSRGKEIAASYRHWNRTLRERYLRPYVFIHINKTGGSSFEKALNITLDHSTAQEKYQQLGARAWQRKFKFSIVRNPWDKVVSHYHYRVNTQQTTLGYRALPFEEWLQCCYLEKDPDFYDQPRMFQPQRQWLVDEHGDLLVDYIGRFETLEADFDHVCAELGLDLQLGHAKPSSRAGYRDYYDEESRDLIAGIFAEDIELFGYQF